MLIRRRGVPLVLLVFLLASVVVNPWMGEFARSGGARLAAIIVSERIPLVSASINEDGWNAHFGPSGWEYLTTKWGTRSGVTADSAVSISPAGEQQVRCVLTYSGSTVEWIAPAERAPEISVLLTRVAAAQPDPSDTYQTRRAAYQRVLSLDFENDSYFVTNHLPFGGLWRLFVLLGLVIASVWSFAWALFPTSLLATVYQVWRTLCIAGAVTCFLMIALQSTPASPDVGGGQ